MSNNVYRHALKILEFTSLSSTKRGAMGIHFPKFKVSLAYANFDPYFRYTM